MLSYPWKQSHTSSEWKSVPAREPQALVVWRHQYFPNWSSVWAQYQSVTCFFVESDKLNFTGKSTGPRIAKPLEKEEEREEFAYTVHSCWFQNPLQRSLSQRSVSHKDRCIHRRDKTWSLEFDHMAMASWHKLLRTFSWVAMLLNKFFDTSKEPHAEA